MPAETTTPREVSDDELVSHLRIADALALCGVGNAMREDFAERARVLRRHLARRATPTGERTA